MRQPKSAHRKTQTPIVAKQVEIEQGYFYAVVPTSQNLRFYRNLKAGTTKKGIVSL